LREFSACINVNYKYADIKITPINGEVEKEQIKEKLKNLNLDYDIFSNYSSIEQQLKHQIILNIDGHSSSWERPLWIMASNSICLNIRPYNIFQSWYSLFLDAYNIIPNIDLNIIDDYIESNDFTDDYWTNTKSMQKLFASTICDYSIQLHYLNNVLRHYNKQFNLKNK
jgi:hypothetical protein